MNIDKFDTAVIPPPEYDGGLYQVPNGQWGFLIEADGELILRTGGYRNEDEARMGMCDFLEPYVNEAFVAKMFAEGGYVGEDELGRLARTLPGGEVELIVSGKGNSRL